MKYLEGDLIKLANDGLFDVIAHGCNCMCTMGAGIAKYIRAEFPEAYEADNKTTRGDKGKLGTCSYAKRQIKEHELFIVNAYTQYDWKGKKPLVDYTAIESCARWIKQNFKGKRIGLPKIGAGLAGGDWQMIEQILAKELIDEDVTIVVFK